MKREIRTVDTARNVVQITTEDQRFYARQLNANGVGASDGEPIWDFVPSTSWICSYYHKGEGILRFVAKHGFEEAEEIKELAGDRGSKVHQAINRLVNGGTVGIHDLFENPRSLQQEELDSDEYWRVITFQEWFEKTRPRVLRSEYTVWNERYRYAGTVDLLLEIAGVAYLVDVKTSAQVWPSMEIQVAAYKHADPTLPKNTKLAILQVGYKYNKIQKYKFTPVADQFPLFLATRKIWQREAKNIQPFQREYPLSISLSSELTLRENGVVA